MIQEWEQPCVYHELGIHCECYYQDKACCDCGLVPCLTTMEEIAANTKGEHPLWG